MSVRVEVSGAEKEQVNEWIRFGMKVAIQGILHPIEYSKVLIQVSD
jgi:primosomal replication protein N